MPELIDRVFAKQSPTRSVIENERLGLVFAKTGSINSGTGFKGGAGRAGGRLLFSEENSFSSISLQLCVEFCFVQGSSDDGNATLKLHFMRHASQEKS